MKHKINILFLLLFVCFCFSQKIITGKVIDSSTLLPIPNVEISTENNQTTVTNSEGKFYLPYSGGSIIFDSPNYHLLEIYNIKDGDQFLLTQLPIKEIEAISVENYKLKIEQIHKKIPINFLFSSYSENLYVRGSLKRNNKLFKVIDIAGKVWRNTIVENSKQKSLTYKIHISNLRKAGKEFKNNDSEYFKMSTFKELLSRVKPKFIDPKVYNFYKTELLDSLYSKFYFSDKNNSLTGYYIVNNKDLAIISINYTITALPDFTSKRNFKWRTTHQNVSINFSYNNTLQKYTQSNCILNYEVELFNPNNLKTTYNLEYHLLFSNPNLSSISYNASVNKELFKLSGNYDEKFWQNQNQLLLTQEMKQFILSLKDNNEYKIILNK